MNALLGCDQPQNSNLGYYWAELDFVAGNIDIAFGSPECPIQLTSVDAINNFEADPDIQATYAKYVIKNQAGVGGVINFQNCSEALKAEIQHDSSNVTAFGNFSSTVKLWHVFEDSFNCTGWCRSTYTNPDFNATTNTCMDPDKINPCNCIDTKGNACTSCVDSKDNKTACTKFTRMTRNLEKYLFTDVNK